MKTQIPQNQRKENFQKNASLVQRKSEYCKFKAKHFEDEATLCAQVQAIQPRLVRREQVRYAKFTGALDYDLALVIEQSQSQNCLSIK